MTEPTFPYPSPTDRHVFIKCDKDDPQREEFWCPKYEDWKSFISGGGPENCSDKLCGQTWRKRVEVPVGFEIIPKGEEIGAGAMFLHTHTHQWERSVNTGWIASETANIYIRPIAKASEESYLTSGQFKAIHQIPDAQPANPYAVTIKGVTFDYYEFCKAAQITDQPIAHALKKLWRNGKGHKSAQQDVQEAIRSLQRWQEIEGGK